MIVRIYRLRWSIDRENSHQSLDRSAASQKIRKNSQKSDKVWNPYARSAFRTLKSEVMRLNSDFCLQIANRPFNSGFVRPNSNLDGKFTNRGPKKRNWPENRRSGQRNLSLVS